MNVPQRGQQHKGNGSIISTQKTPSQACSRDSKSSEEQLAKSLMWPNRSVAGQNQRGEPSSDITNGNVLRWFSAGYAII